MMKTAYGRVLWQKFAGWIQEKKLVVQRQQKEIIEKMQPQGLQDPDWGYGPSNKVVDLSLI